MKLSMFLTGIVSLAAAAMTSAFPADGPAPLHKAVVTCFNNVKDESAGFCSGTCYQADGTTFKTGNLTCGHPGKVSEVEWEYLGQRGGKDRYRFTRRFPIGSPKVATTRKEVEFEGKRINIFEGNIQRIIIEGPKE